MPRNRSSTFVGLNIEPGRISAARVSVNGTISVEHGALAEIDVAAVRDGEVADVESLAGSLRDLWSDHPELGRQVRIGVANALIVVRTIELPPIEDREQLANAVRFRAGDEIPMPLASAVLDFQPVGIVDTPQGPRMRVAVVAARRDMIAATLAAARAAGLRPEGIDLAAFGMLRALRRPDRSTAMELFASVGGLTNLAIAGDGICAFTRVAGTGLEGMAVELAERRSLSLDRARTWLHHIGLDADLHTFGDDPETEADARAVLVEGTRRVGAEIRGSLDFHQAQPGGGPGVERVVLTGPAVAVPGFAAALSAELALDVEERVVSGAHGVALDALEAGCLSVAAGLAVEDVAA